MTKLSEVYVPGYGNPNAKILILGEAPGAEEEKQGKPFVGASGRFLDEYLSYADISRAETYCTNVLKYRPPGNDLKELKKLGIKIEDSYPDLYKEIRTVNPNVILSLGNVPLKALTGLEKILNYRGSILSTNVHPYKAVVTIHPSALLRSAATGALPYSMRQVFLLDLKRAVEESKYKAYNPVRRQLQICKSSNQLRQFLSLYSNRLLVSIDIETQKCIPSCIALAFNPTHSLSIPLLSAKGILESYSELLEIYKLLANWFLTPGLRIIGQNFKFDQEKLEAPLGFTVPDPYFDTMLAGHTLHPELPQKLAFLASIYTREPYYKDEYKEFDPRKDKLDQIFLYNAKDAAVTYELYLSLLKYLQEDGLENFFFSYVMKLHRLYRDIESVGFKVNKEKRADLLADYSRRIDLAERELATYSDEPVNFKSPKQVAKFLLSLGLPERDGTGEDVLVALQANNCKNNPEAERSIDLILNIRRYYKTKNTYLEAELDYDDRLRTSYKITGTETGRSATSVLRPPIRPTQVGWGLHSVTKHGDVGQEVRSICEADEGYDLIHIDLSQAEARIVALFANDEYLLDLFERGEDVHSITASWIFDKPPAQIDRNTERFIGKTSRHAGGYNAGKRRYMLSINSDIKRFKIAMSPISEQRAGQILDRFHAKSPNIRGVFHREIQEALHKDRTFTNPYGRKRIFMNAVGDEMYREAYAHSASSTVSDHLKNALLRIKKLIPDLKIVAEEHDAITCLTPKDLSLDYARVIKKEFETPIDFTFCTLSRGELKIPADVELGPNYKDMVKVKL